MNNFITVYCEQALMPIVRCVLNNFVISQKLNNRNLNFKFITNKDMPYDILYTNEDNNIGKIYIPINHGFFKYEQGHVKYKNENIPLDYHKIEDFPFKLKDGLRVIFKLDIIWEIFNYFNFKYEKIEPIKHSLYLKTKSLRNMEKFKKPYCNYLFLILEHAFLKTNLIFEETKKKYFHIALSHDVDSIKKKISERVKCSGAALTLPKTFNINNIKKAFKLFWGNAEYNQMNKIMDIESKFNFTSTFNFFAKVKPVTFNWFKYFLNPHYNIDNIKVQNILQEIKKRGFEVGLHGSIYSYNCFQNFINELKKIETILQTKVISNRFHHLKYEFRNTLRILSDSPIKIDASRGFSNLNGFRDGIATPFIPFDDEKQKNYDILEVPLILNDGTLFRFENLTYEEAKQRSIELLNEVKKVNGLVSILWHTASFSDDYLEWGKLYEKILLWILDNDGQGVSLNNFYKKIIIENE